MGGADNSFVNQFFFLPFNILYQGVFSLWRLVVQLPLFRMLCGNQQEVWFVQMVACVSELELDGWLMRFQVEAVGTFEGGCECYEGFVR